MNKVGTLAAKLHYYAFVRNEGVGGGGGGVT